ncbi:MAG: metal ABC transporter solute-binding protein, Zn/Mn family [Nitrosopumilaceae archaeon]
MFNQTRAAIIAIALIIPLSTIAMWNSTRFQEFTETSMENQKIVALASFYPLYEFTKEVGKDKVDVSLLVPPGIEPHDWEPSIQDLQIIQQADIIIINGIGFENWFEDIEKLNLELTIIDSSNGINIINEINSDQHEDSHFDASLADPHIWLNPSLAKIQVKNIVGGLIELDPDNSPYYHDNYENYIKKLDILDSKIRDELSNCSKDFVAFHSAFTYFAKEYGLNQHTIVSNEPHSESTSKTLEKIISLAKEMKIQIIFTEEGIDKRTSEVIAKELGGKVLTLSPLEISETSTTYIEKMEVNLANLKEALCN